MHPWILGSLIVSFYQPSFGFWLSSYCCLYGGWLGQLPREAGNTWCSWPPGLPHLCEWTNEPMRFQPCGDSLCLYLGSTWDLPSDLCGYHALSGPLHRPSGQGLPSSLLHSVCAHSSKAAPGPGILPTLAISSPALQCNPRDFSHT